MKISHCKQAIENSENVPVSEMRDIWDMFWYQHSCKKYELALLRTVRAKTEYNISDGLKAALVALNRPPSKL